MNTHVDVTASVVVILNSLSPPRKIANQSVVRFDVELSLLGVHRKLMGGDSEWGGYSAQSCVPFPGTRQFDPSHDGA